MPFCISYCMQYSAMLNSLLHMRYEMQENISHLNSINRRICQFRMNLRMNMQKCEACNWTECLRASIFSLCLALSSVTAQAVCQAVCFVCVKYLCISPVMCFGDAPVANTSLPPSLCDSRSFSVCLSSTYYIRLLAIVLRWCLPLSCSLSPHLSVTLWKSNTTVHFIPYSKGHPFFRTVWK